MLSLYHIVGNKFPTLVVGLHATLNLVLGHEQQKLGRHHGKSESSGESTLFRPRLLRGSADCQHVAACCSTSLDHVGRDRVRLPGVPAPAVARDGRCLNLQYEEIVVIVQSKVL